MVINDRSTTGILRAPHLAPNPHNHLWSRFSNIFENHHISTSLFSLQWRSIRWNSSDFVAKETGHFSEFDKSGSISARLGNIYRSDDFLKEDFHPGNRIPMKWRNSLRWSPDRWVNHFKRSVYRPKNGKKWCWGSYLRLKQMVRHGESRYGYRSRQ